MSSRNPSDDRGKAELPADWPPPANLDRSMEIHEPMANAASTGAKAHLEALLFAKNVARAVETRLVELSQTYLSQGRPLTEIGSPDEVAHRLLAVLPSPSLWDQHLGPFYGSAQIAKALGGVSRQAIAERRARRTLIALRTADGHWVYPAFQFDEHHSVLPDLVEIWQTLGKSGDEDWTLAGWLVAGQRSLGGESPVAWLRAGKSATPVLSLARELAARLAQ